MTWTILNDTTLCIGCEKCVKACKAENELGKDVPRRWKRRIDDLSSTRYTTIVRHPKNSSVLVRQQCRHCAEPACASACLVGALKKKDEGPVTYDSSKCMGCRYCMMACPYGIPRYAWEEPVPYVRKCDMCYERVKDDEEKKPACVEACPTEATKFFLDRDKAFEEADRRIRDNPGLYNNKVFGKTEIGGTSVIYLCGKSLDLDFLAFKPNLGDVPLPDLTWAALSKVPPIIAGVGALMTGTWWIIGRRMKLAEEAAQAATEEKEEN